MKVNGRPLAEIPLPQGRVNAGDAFEEMAVAKAWGKDPDQWQRIGSGAQELMIAYERASNRIGAALEVKLPAMAKG